MQAKEIGGRLRPKGNIASRGGGKPQYQTSPNPATTPAPESIPITDEQEGNSPFNPLNAPGFGGRLSQNGPTPPPSGEARTKFDNPNWLAEQMGERNSRIAQVEMVVPESLRGPFKSFAIENLVASNKSDVEQYQKWLSTKISLPSLDSHLQEVEKLQRLNDQEMGKVRDRLLQPPPEVDEYVNPDADLALSVLAAMVFGVDPAMANNSVFALEQDRSKKEFDNRMRKFQSTREVNLMDYQRLNARDQALFGLDASLKGRQTDLDLLNSQRADRGAEVGFTSSMAENQEAYRRESAREDAIWGADLELAQRKAIKELDMVDTLALMQANYDQFVAQGEQGQLWSEMDAARQARFSTQMFLIQEGIKKAQSPQEANAVMDGIRAMVPSLDPQTASLMMNAMNYLAAGNKRDADEAWKLAMEQFAVQRDGMKNQKDIASMNNDTKTAQSKPESPLTDEEIAAAGADGATAPRRPQFSGSVSSGYEELISKRTELDSAIAERDALKKVKDGSLADELLGGKSQKDKLAEVNAKITKLEKELGAKQNTLLSDPAFRSYKTAWDNYFDNTVAALKRGLSGEALSLAIQEVRDEYFKATGFRKATQ